MDIRLGSIPPDSTRDSGSPEQRAKRVKARKAREEEAWSERSDHDELIEDCYIPSEQKDQEAGD